MTSKEPHISVNEPYISAKETYISAKETYISTIETYISTKKTYTCTKETNLSAEVKRFVSLVKIIGLFCKRALWKKLYSAKETSPLKGPVSPQCVGEFVALILP